MKHKTVKHYTKKFERLDRVLDPRETGSDNPF